MKLFDIEAKRASIGRGFHREVSEQEAAIKPTDDRQAEPRPLALGFKGGTPKLCRLTDSFESVVL